MTFFKQLTTTQVHIFTLIALVCKSYSSVFRSTCFHYKQHNNHSVTLGSFPAATPSTPVCQKDEFRCSSGRCISSSLRCNYFNDCEDYGSDEINCNKKGSWRHATIFIIMSKAVMRCRQCDCKRPVSLLSDTVLNDCHSNRTVCGDGDEAHCVVNGTDSFCSCKPGFQSNGKNRCEGAVLLKMA